MNFQIIFSRSLRVNLDMAKILYSWVIQRDSHIPGTVVRSSTIPEEMGRVEYLLTDKTGTLTQNEMVRESHDRVPCLWCKYTVIMGYGLV